MSTASKDIEAKRDDDSSAFNYEERPEQWARKRLPTELPESLCRLYKNLGFEGSKHNNAFLLDDTTLLLAGGTCVRLLRTDTLESTYIKSKGCGGVGALAVSNSKTYFAVGERALEGERPNIFVYEYPTLKLLRVLRRGTENAYTALAFSASGEKIASVGSFPDYMLTVWDWKREKIILRNKAFSQEIFNVSFSSEDDGILITSGTGHIRFWKMARTFTGLKLQGDIGKFGKAELSDIHGYAEMPTSGMTLSGSESGSLLLWDGNLVKLEIFRTDHTLPHDGSVDVVILEGSESTSRYFITAGADGIVRWWDYNEIDSAELTDEAPEFMIDPIQEVKIRETVRGAGAKNRAIAEEDRPVHIVGMTRGSGHWIIQDKNGALWRMDAPPPGKIGIPRKICRVVDFHGGRIQALDASPSSHFVASAGVDGRVCCWDATAKGLGPIFSRTFTRIPAPVVAHDDGEDSKMSSSDVDSAEVTCIPTTLRFAPTTLDPSGRTAAVGFENGTVRILVRAEKCWRLASVFKPHSGIVTFIEFSDDGKRMATIGDDDCLWFFNIESVSDESFERLFSPVGFVRLNGATSTRCLEWRPDSNRVLLAQGTSGVLEIEAPREYIGPSATKEELAENVAVKSEDDDTKEAASFEISLDSLYSRRFVYERPTTQSKDDEKSESDDTDNKDIGEIESRPDPSILAASYKKAMPGNDASVEGNDSSEQQNANTWSVFYITLADDDAGTLLECRWIGTNADAVVQRQYENHHSGPCECVRNNTISRFFLSASSDGSVLVRPKSYMERFLMPRFHDGTFAGAISLAITYDERFLISGGPDEQLIVVELESDGLIAASAGAKEEFTSTLGATYVSAVASDDPESSGAIEANMMEDVADIVSDSTYTIQDDRLKTKEDMRRKRADMKKKAVMVKVRALQNEFSKVRAKNNSLGAGFGLPDEAFDLDAEIKTEVIVDGKNMVDEVEKELAWDLERSRIGVQKLKRVFLDNCVTESAKMRGICIDDAVCSYRVGVLSDTAQKLKVRGKSQTKTRTRRTTFAVPTSNGRKAADLLQRRLTSFRSRKSMSGSGARSHTSNDEAKKNSWEVRSDMRKKRVAHLAKLLDQKPSMDAEDPRDVAAIRDAIENMGDFKLKTSSDYVVPDDACIDIAGKREQMASLELSIHNIRVGFNTKFNALRDLKSKIVDRIESWKSRLGEIGEDLGDASDVDTSMYRCLMEVRPEIRTKVSDTEVQSFEMKKLNIKDPLPLPLPSTKNGAESAVKSSDNDGDDVRDSWLEMYHPNLVWACRIEDDPLTIVGPIDTAAATSMSKFEIAAMKRHKHILRGERSKLLRQIRRVAKSFDKKLVTLRAEKIALDAKLNMAQARFLVLTSESRILQEFDARDKALDKKMVSLQRDKVSLEKQISECEIKLSQKLDDVEVWQEKSAKVMEAFELEVGGPNNALYQPLYKIFKRKVRRNQNADGSDSETDDDDEDESDTDDDEDESDDDDAEETCPPNCRQELFETVKQLREKRLDQEDILKAFNKTIQDMKKSLNRYKQRAEQIDKDILSTIGDIRGLQTEKQHAINVLEVSLPLRLSQLCALMPSTNEESSGAAGTLELPKDIEECVVFDKTRLAKLRRRVGELEDDTKKLSLELKSLHKLQKKLRREKKEKEKEIATNSKKCQDFQMLKFGHELDLESLDKMSATKAVVDAQRKVTLQAIQRDREIRRGREEIKAEQERLLAATRENTTLLSQLAQLTARVQSLDAEISKSGGGMRVKPIGMSARDVQERKRLVQLVRLQAREIDALKIEINSLRRGKRGNPFA